MSNRNTDKEAMRSLLILVLTLFIGAACKTKTASVSSGSVSANAPFLWESGFPKNMYVSEAFSTPDEQAKGTDAKVTASMATWESSLNNTNFFVEVGTIVERTDSITSPNQLRDNVFAVYKATNWPYPQYPDALAITQIFALRENAGDSDEFLSIREADIIMNYEDFYFDEIDTNIYDYDFRTVLVHELGHFLGLQHKPESYPRGQTVMYPRIYSQSVETKPDPFLVDRQDLALKYGITLPATAGGSAITSAPRVYKARPGTTGEMIKIILELKANGECVHHADGVEFARHQMRK